jgi:uncharacterized protein DUF4411
VSKYLLDSDVLIRAKNDYYGMDFCPAFWEWLIAESKAGRVCSIKAICDELIQRPDPVDEDDEEDVLSKWARQDGSCLFLPHDQPMADKLPVVALWARSQHYTQGAISTFLGCADYYLVSYAMAHGYTVVTNEVPSTSKQKIKIPDACVGLSVPRTRLCEMLRALGAKFVLG